ncbi:LysR substrate-binding domain-containing protein [Sinorhizobium fredii]|uniref:LysR-type transcriptional regulator n=2 Tax=Rhizobium fredii TaxID=380 RepID=G9AAB2_SINF1|nr:LysR substrate-binding domain-containing protein [Sinorhizobium fredii]CCE97016.1 LysR-type transcriptional regulator [Sinorhizobium fredii HH103]
MDVVQLKTLIHVAELGSLSKAADRLHIAQPALSRQIRLLEKELGVFLFERHGRGMVITDVGREVLEHATRVMFELEAIRNSVAEGRRTFRGMVVMGMTPTVAEIMTVPLVNEIKKAHPELSIRVLSAFSGHLLDWLQRGELELAVSYDPEPLRSLRIKPIMIENLMYVSADKEHPLNLDVPVPFAELGKVELVLPSPRHGLRGIVEACAREAGVELKTSVEADSFGAMIDLVRNGFGATVLPLAPIYSLVNAGHLSAAPLVDPTPARKLVMAHSADRPVSPAARFVGETFRNIAADLVARDVWIGHMI